MKKINIYVTGANGFIGKSLIEYLNKIEKYNIVGISHAENNSFSNNIIYSDYKNIEWLKSILVKNSILIHTAAHIPKAQNECLDKEVFDINVNIDRFIASAFLEFVESVMYFSSISVYGYGYIDLIKVTEKSSINAFDYYSKSKIFGENIIQKYYKNKEYILRLSSPYGKNKKNKGILETITYNAINGYDIEIYRNGDRTQDYVYISDICKVVSIIINNKPENGVYNLASGNSCKMSNLVKTIVEIFKSNSQIINIDKEESPSVCINNTKICKEMNVSFLDIKTGIYNLMKTKGE